MTSDYVKKSIKLCPKLEMMIKLSKCNFGGRSMSGFELTKGNL